jgi:hypothetical protein
MLKTFQKITQSAISMKEQCITITAKDSDEGTGEKAQFTCQKVQKAKNTITACFAGKQNSSRFDWRHESKQQELLIEKGSQIDKNATSKFIIPNITTTIIQKLGCLVSLTWQ